MSKRELDVTQSCDKLIKVFLYHLSTWSLMGRH